MPLPGKFIQARTVNLLWNLMTAQISSLQFSPPVGQSLGWKKCGNYTINNLSLLAQKQLYPTYSHWPISQAPVIWTFQYFRQTTWLYQKPYITNAFWLSIPPSSGVTAWYFVLISVRAAYFFGVFCIRDTKSIPNAVHGPRRWQEINNTHLLEFTFGSDQMRQIPQDWNFHWKSKQKLWSCGLSFTWLLLKISRMPHDP